MLPQVNLDSLKWKAASLGLPCWSSNPRSAILSTILIVAAVTIIILFAVSRGSGGSGETHESTPFTRCDSNKDTVLKSFRAGCLSYENNVCQLASNSVIHFEMEFSTANTIQTAWTKILWQYSDKFQLGGEFACDVGVKCPSKKNQPQHLKWDYKPSNNLVEGIGNMRFSVVTTDASNGTTVLACAEFPAEVADSL